MTMYLIIQVFYVRSLLVGDPNLGSYSKAFCIRELDLSPGWEGRTVQNVFLGLERNPCFKNEQLLGTELNIPRLTIDIPWPGWCF